MKCLIVYYMNGHWIGEEVSWKRSGSGSYREVSRIEIPQSKAQIEAFAAENRFVIEWRGKVPAEHRRRECLSGRIRSRQLPSASRPFAGIGRRIFLDIDPQLGDGRREAGQDQAAMTWSSRKTARPGIAVPGQDRDDRFKGSTIQYSSRP